MRKFVAMAIVSLSLIGFGAVTSMGYFDGDKPVAMGYFDGD
jgi:hypothetical protein